MNPSRPSAPQLPVPVSRLRLRRIASRVLCPAPLLLAWLLVPEGVTAQAPAAAQPPPATRTAPAAQATPGVAPAPAVQTPTNTQTALAPQDLDGIATGAASDLQKALAELNTARQEVEAERIPLARQLSDLEQKLVDRKAKFAKDDRFQENQKVELSALQKEAAKQSDEVKQIESLLTEYARSFETRVNPVEKPRYNTIFDEVRAAAVAPDLASSDRFAKRSVILTTSLKRTEQALGGDLFEGQALDNKGLVQKGKVALVGPVAVFSSTSGDVAGALQEELNKGSTIVEMDKDLTQGSRDLATTGKGMLPLDATLGNAFKLSALEESLYEKVSKGGLVMIPLLALGLSALLVALFKYIQFARIRLATEADLQKVLRHIENGEQDKALAHARSISGPAGEMLATAVEHSDEKKEYIEELVYEKMLGARTRLERGVAFLALTATAGPLMGLLGTVMGMIATFKLISSFGSGDPKLLAAGISEALIATATGMAVAIPALLLHAFLSRKSKAIIGSMEQTAVGFINGLPDHESKEKNAFA